MIFTSVSVCLLFCVDLAACVITAIQIEMKVLVFALEI